MTGPSGAQIATVPSGLVDPPSQHMLPVGPSMGPGVHCQGETHCCSYLLISMPESELAKYPADYIAASFRALESIPYTFSPNVHLCNCLVH